VHKWSGKGSFARIWASPATWFAIVLLAMAGAQVASAQGTITSLSPSSVPAGSSQFNLLVTVANLPGGIHTVYWSGQALPTSDVNSSQVQAVVAAALVGVPGTVAITVQALSDVLLSTPPATFTITGPIIASLQPSSVIAGHAAFTLTVNGSGFTAVNGYPVVYFGGTSSSAVPTTFIGNTQLQAAVPAALVASPGSVQVTVLDPDGSVSPAFPFTIVQPLRLVPQSMPGGVVGSFYDFTFQTTGGAAPLVFTVAGLPSTLSLNRATGEISGTPAQVATYPISLTVTDSTGQTASGQYSLSVSQPQIPPLQFTTFALPAGQVGVAYMAVIGATGGVSPYTFSLAAGSASLPAGLTLYGSAIAGTPTTVGTSKFTLQLQDSAGTTVSQAFTLPIAPPPLTITTGALSNATAGTPLSITFSATGGYPGYTFSANLAIPGMTVSGTGTLAGTPTTPGTYLFTVIVKDSTGTTASKIFSLTILPPPLAILTAALPNGQVGVVYAVQFYAINGQPPYAWAASGAPAGLAMSGAGSFGGTPAADGPFTLTVTVTDAANNQAKQSFPLTIAAAPLVINSAILPAGVAGTAYSATLSASGGDAPYTWTVQGLPSGITASAGGALSGTPAAAGNYTVTATVTDSKGVTASRTYNLTITAAPIAITTASLPGGTVGSPYSATLAASGGAGSNRWAATGLPSGLTMSAGGIISGTPTAPGLSVVAVTVTDAAGTVGVQTFTLTVVLPATPAVEFNSLPATANPGTQPLVQVGMASAYPLPVTVTLTLTFTPDSGADDPSVQFSTGGRVVVIQIPAGATALTGTAALQTGTVAGTITIAAQLSAAGQDITPTPAPSQTIRIIAAAPVIGSVTAIRTASGFTVTVIGFSTPRQVTQAAFLFAAAASANLQTTSLTIATTSLFSTWYSSAAASPYGSQFSFVQPFTVTGDTTGITSVTVTLTNAQGTSAAVTANLQ